MTSLRVVAFCLLAGVGLGPHAATGAEIIRLASLEWPPYTGAELPDGGESTATLKAAFAAAGYQLEVDFLPWERALALAKVPNSGYAGYFPEYFSDAVSESFLFSVTIGYGPLGLAERRNQPLQWQQPADLQRYRIGTVQGYVNTQAFDQAVADGLQPVETAGSDSQNLKKLAAGRIDAAIIDPHVMRHLLHHDASLANIKHLLAFNPRLLENKALYVCFRKSPDAARLADALAEGLARIRLRGPAAESNELLPQPTPAPAATPANTPANDHRVTNSRSRQSAPR